MSVEIDGLEALERRLQQLKRDGDVRVREEVSRTLHNIEQHAKRDAPVETGALRDSIRVELSDGGMAGRVGTSLPYAVFMEFGRRHKHARPFLWPAALYERGEMHKRLIAMLRDLVREKGK